MTVIEQYDAVADDARSILEMFSRNYRKKEGRSIGKHALTGAAVGGAIGAIPGGIAVVPGAAVGAAAGYGVGKVRAFNKRVRKVSRFARNKGAKFD